MASEAAKLYGQGGEQARRFLRRSVIGSGQVTAWSPPEVPGIHKPSFFRAQARR